MKAGAWAWLVMGVVTWTALRAVGGSKVKLTGHGYEGLVVGISPQLDESQGAEIISAIKAMIEEGSSYLLEATQQRLFFKEVKILIPKWWKNTPADKVATTERFEASDIRVDTEVPAYGSQPFTKQLGDCGEPGEHIHLTPEYLTEDYYVAFWGPRGKHLVSLWAKLRWGVFDEMGYKNDRMYPQFYVKDYITLTTNPTPIVAYNVCTDVPVIGKREDSRTGGNCTVAPVTNVPTATCNFIPDKVQVAASSLMTDSNVLRGDSVRHFCNHTTHDVGAPTKQNFMCRGESVWDVLQRHPDFTQTAGSVASPPPGPPQVTVVQEEDGAFVAVLDYSASMLRNQRIQKLQQQVRLWVLHELPDNSSVAVVQFNNWAHVMVPLKRLVNKTVREEVASKIDTNVFGSTTIGAGIQKALEILNGTSNKNILVVTDGEENRWPFISGVKTEVQQAGVCIDTVAYGGNADPNLEELSKLTGCMANTVDDNNSTTMLVSAIKATRQYSSQLQDLDIKIYVSRDIRTTKRTVSDVFFVDASVGRNLTFHLSTDHEQHIVSPPSLIHPDGSRTTAAPSDFDRLGLVWTIMIPLAEEGSWRWEATVGGTRKHFVLATVTARQRDLSTSDAPITTTVRVRHSGSVAGGVNASANRIIVSAEVKKGSKPVIGASVEAQVFMPGNSSQQLYTFPLRDAGQQPDSMANDGIYSGYLTRFTTAGRYSFGARVVGTGSTAIPGGGPSTTGRRRRRRRSLPPAVPEPPAPCCGSVMPFDPSTATPSGNFLRVASGGSIKVNEVPRAGSDSFPPSRVRDLQVEALDLYVKEAPLHNLTISWTTPGDDLDVGTVSNYVFRLSSSRNALTEAKFNTAPPDTLLPVTKAELHRANVLLEAGHKVFLSIMYNGTLSHRITYYVALTAIDDGSNVSEVSNVARFTLEEVLVLPPWADSRIQTLEDINARFQELVRKSKRNSP